MDVRVVLWLLCVSVFVLLLFCVVCCRFGLVCFGLGCCDCCVAVICWLSLLLRDSEKLVRLVCFASFCFVCVCVVSVCLFRFVVI